MGEDGAIRRDGARHHLDHRIDARGVERRQPAGFHERSTPINEKRIEYGQQAAVGDRVDVAAQQCSEFEERRDLSCFTLTGVAAPGWNDQDDKRSVGAGNNADLHGQGIRRGGRDVGRSLLVVWSRNIVGTPLAML